MSASHNHNGAVPAVGRSGTMRTNRTRNRSAEAPPPPPPVAHSRSRNISDESGPPPAPGPQVTRSATVGRGNQYGSATHSRAGRRRANMQVRDFAHKPTARAHGLLRLQEADDPVYGEYDASRTLRRIKNLSGLEHPDFAWSKCTGNKRAVCVRLLQNLDAMSEGL